MIDSAAQTLSTPSSPCPSPAAHPGRTPPTLGARPRPRAPAPNPGPAAQRPRAHGGGRPLGHRDQGRKAQCCVSGWGKAICPGLNDAPPPHTPAQAFSISCPSPRGSRGVQAQVEGVGGDAGWGTSSRAGALSPVAAATNGAAEKQEIHYRRGGQSQSRSRGTLLNPGQAEATAFTELLNLQALNAAAS